MSCKLKSNESPLWIYRKSCKNDKSIVVNGEVVDEWKPLAVLDESTPGVSNLIIHYAILEYNGIWACVERDGQGVEHHFKLNISRKYYCCLLLQNNNVTFDQVVSSGRHSSRVI